MPTGDKALILVTVKERVKVLLARLDVIENEIKTFDVEIRALLAQVSAAQLSKPRGD